VISALGRLRNRVSRGTGTIAKSSVSAPALALLILAITLVPTGVWRHPENDAQYYGFDQHLLYVAPSGPADDADARVVVRQDTMQVTVRTNSEAVIHLTTTYFPRLRVEFGVVLLDTSADVVPFQIAVWSPTARSGLVVKFGPPPDHVISAELVEGGGGSTIHEGTRVFEIPELGHYLPGHNYDVKIELDRLSGRLTVQVTGDEDSSDDDAQMSWKGSLDRSEAPGLFRSAYPSVTAWVASGGTETTALLRGLSVSVPHQSRHVERVADPRATLTVVVLLAFSALLVLSVAAGHLRTGSAIREPARFIRRVGRNLKSIRVRGGLNLPLAGGAILLAYLLGSVFAARAASGFDMNAQRVWAYVAANYGLADLYYLPGLTPNVSPAAGYAQAPSIFPYQTNDPNQIAGLNKINMPPNTLQRVVAFCVRRIRRARTAARRTNGIFASFTNISGGSPGSPPNNRCTIPIAALR